MKGKVSTLEQEIKDVSRIYDEEKRCLQLELKAEVDKRNQILNQIKDKVECPVCMEVPRSGPFPVCPNGHFVCRRCKTGACPTCRVAMGNGMSLLAGIVVDNIKHGCRFVDCEESFAVDKVEDHEKICQHRIVSCPHDLCKEKFALSNVLKHLQFSEQKCALKTTPVIDGNGGATFFIYSEEDLSKSE